MAQWVTRLTTDQEILGCLIFERKIYFIYQRNDFLPQNKFKESSRTWSFLQQVLVLQNTD